MYINFKQMVQVEMSVSKASPIMRPIVNRDGVWLLMPHPVPILKPKESVIACVVILEEILEGMFWLFELDASKDLTYTHTGTNY